MEEHPKDGPGSAPSELEIRPVSRPGAPAAALVIPPGLLPHSQEILARARPGSALGHYHLTELVGIGGHGVVYRATDQRDASRVAVKVLRTPADRIAPEQMSIFEADRKLVRRIQHRALVKLYEVGVHENLIYLAMDFFEGPFGGAMSLADYAQFFPEPIETYTVRKIFLHLLDAMACVHRHGVIHCDLKPANILFRFKGSLDREQATYWRVDLKVTDFGIIRLLGEPVLKETIRLSRERQERQQTTGADTLAVLTSLQYMSPQQVLGRPATVQTDIYAIGRILQQLLTGAPCPTDQPPTALRADLDPAWDQVVVRATHREEGQRFASVTDMAQAIAAIGA
jgi:serine/threonine protein kinase